MNRTWIKAAHAHRLYLTANPNTPITLRGFRKQLDRYDRICDGKLLRRIPSVEVNRTVLLQLVSEDEQQKLDSAISGIADLRERVFSVQRILRKRRRKVDTALDQLTKEIEAIKAQFGA